MVYTYFAKTLALWKLRGSASQYSSLQSSSLQYSSLQKEDATLEDFAKRGETLEDSARLLGFFIKMSALRLERGTFHSPVHCLTRSATAARPPRRGGGAGHQMYP